VEVPVAICSANNCQESAHARTFCHTHYSRWCRHGDATVVLKAGNKPGVPHSWSRRGVENKNTARARATPSLRDITWAAGFLEGEGSFVRRGGSLTVTAGQVNEEPLRRMLALFGGSLKAYTTNRPRTPRVWTWLASGARGRGVALTVYSFLSTRRQEQIRNAL
jgi:hypothetical protein